MRARARKGRKVLDCWRQVRAQQNEGQGEKSQKPAKADTLAERARQPGATGPLGTPSHAVRVPQARP